MDDLDKEIKGKIINFLGSNEATTSVNIAESIGHNRITISKYLHIMYANGLVEYKKVGKARLWSLKQKEKIKILIVDDEPHIINLIKLSLRNSGYVIYEAYNAMEALQKTKEFLPHIIILDLMMPTVSGFDVCKIVKENKDTKDIKIIVLSAKTQSEDKKRAFELGADDYLSKPFDPEELQIRIGSQLSKIPVRDSKKVPLLSTKLELTQANILKMTIHGMDVFRKRLGSKKTDEFLALLSRMLGDTTKKHNCFLTKLSDNKFIIVGDDSKKVEKEINNAFNSVLPYFYFKKNNSSGKSISLRASLTKPSKEEIKAPFGF